MVKRVLSLYLSLYFVCIGLIIPRAGLAQDKPRYNLAVLSLNAQGVSEVEANLLTERFLSHIGRLIRSQEYLSLEDADLYTLIERTQIERILDEHDYGKDGQFVGLDVKAMRTQKQEVATKHLSNSRTIFLRLVELVRSLDKNKVAKLIQQRDYEELDMLIINHLMGL